VLFFFGGEVAGLLWEGIFGAWGFCIGEVVGFLFFRVSEGYCILVSGLRVYVVGCGAGRGGWDLAWDGRGEWRRKDGEKVWWDY